MSAAVVVGHAVDVFVCTRFQLKLIDKQVLESIAAHGSLFVEWNLDITDTSLG